MSKTPRFLSLALLALARIGLAQSTHAQVASDTAQRHAKYAQLNRQIFHTHEDPDSGRALSQDMAADIHSQLHRLLSDEIMSALTAPDPSERNLRTAIIAVQGESTDVPFAKLFDLNGIKSLAVGYVVLQGNEAIPDTQPYLEFYDRMNGLWERKAEASTQSDFRGCTFFVSKMKSPISTESWFLTWGKTIGDTGSRLKIRLYAFDGVTVRTVSKRDELIAGEITVSADSVSLEYDREYKSTDPNNRVHESLHVSSDGLQ
jgi:hypothetical protein